MSITGDVAPDIEQRIQWEAAQQGQDVPALVRGVLEEHFGAPAPQPTGKPDFFSPESIAAWEAMIDSFSEGDAQEQKESLEWLQKQLDRIGPAKGEALGRATIPLCPRRTDWPWRPT